MFSKSTSSARTLFRVCTFRIASRPYTGRSVGNIVPIVNIYLSKNDCLMFKWWLVFCITPLHIMSRGATSRTNLESWSPDWYFGVETPLSGQSTVQSFRFVCCCYHYHPVVVLKSWEKSGLISTSYVTSCQVVWSHVMWRHVMWCDVISLTLIFTVPVSQDSSFTGEIGFFQRSRVNKSLNLNCTKQ